MTTGIVMGTAMTTDAILTLTQWLSPGFPVGAFAYSHGLETAIATMQLKTIGDLGDWLEDLVAFGGGHADLVILAAAYRARPPEVAQIDATARAFAASADRLLETDQQGAAFARTVDAVWGTDLGPLTYPVAVARAARSQDIALDVTARMYLHAFAANLISASVRLVPLGQTDGQRLLATLAPLITATTERALATALDDLAAPCFAADIAAMQHEILYSKVFRT
ncbi:urease accessory UreF family protein [Roseobacter sp.]|uniref:urease accessory protein UreF n=1 Tax=Roseobacter sp. TaxID=1907202 RepID=UPI0032995923